MPTRRDIFTNGNYYHVFDKTIDKKKVFFEPRYCKIFLNTLEFYSFGNHTTSFSLFRRMNTDMKNEYMQNHFTDKRIIVQLICYTLMPNHYHFLLQQRSYGGIQQFVSNLINSFTRYCNRLHGRKGPLFLPQFKSVSILSLQQLLYTSKYIHLNPVKSGLVESVDDLTHYKWTSYHEYMGYRQKGLVNARPIIRHFDFSPDRYKQYFIGNSDLI